MNAQWQKLFAKVAIWLCAEIALTFMGLDNLADYSEFIFQDRNGHLVSGAPIVLVTAL